MKNLLRWWVVFFFLGIGAAEGMDVGGVNLPDTLAAGDGQLVLNGAGIRKKLFIKVYAAGLYLEEKQNDPNAVIQADAPMAIRMHFIYDGVTPGQLIETWNEGFAATTGGNTASLEDQIQAFNALFTEKAKRGDQYDLIYLPQKGVSLLINQKPLGSVSGLEFKKALFGIWLGQKPADKGLKAGLLGK